MTTLAVEIKQCLAVHSFLCRTCNISARFAGFSPASRRGLGEQGLLAPFEVGVVPTEVVEVGVVSYSAAIDVDGWKIGHRWQSVKHVSLVPGNALKEQAYRL